MKQRWTVSHILTFQVLASSQQDFRCRAGPTATHGRIPRRPHGSLLSPPLKKENDAAPGMGFGLDGLDGLEALVTSWVCFACSSSALTVVHFRANDDLKT